MLDIPIKDNGIAPKCNNDISEDERHENKRQRIENEPRDELYRNLLTTPYHPQPPLTLIKVNKGI